MKTEELKQKYDKLAAEIEMGHPNFIFDARMRLEYDLDCIVETYKAYNTPVKPESLKDIAVQSFNLALSAVISDCQHTLNLFSKRIDLSEITGTDGKQDIRPGV